MAKETIMQRNNLKKKTQKLHILRWVCRDVLGGSVVPLQGTLTGSIPGQGTKIARTLWHAPTPTTHPSPRKIRWLCKRWKTRNMH